MQIFPLVWQKQRNYRAYEKKSVNRNLDVDLTPFNFLFTEKIPQARIKSDIFGESIEKIFLLLRVPPDNFLKISPKKVLDKHLKRTAATQESESSPFKACCKTVNNEGDDENPSSDAIFNSQLRELFAELDTTAFETLQMRELHGEDSDAVVIADRRRDAIVEKILNIALELMNQHDTFKEQYSISKAIDKEIDRRVRRGFDRFDAWRADYETNSEREEPMFYMEDASTAPFTATIEDALHETFNNARDLAGIILHIFNGKTLGNFF